MPRTTMIWVVPLCVALASAAAIPGAGASEGTREKGTEAGEESSPKLSPLIYATGGKGKSTPVKVYTNADLKRVAGTGPGPSESTSVGETPAPSPGADAGGEPAAGAQAQTSALEELLGRGAKQQERERQIAEAEGRVEKAKQRVTDLEKRMLAIRNPFLARPKPPEDEEEAAAWNAGDAPERVDQTKSQLEAAREEVAQAERDLAELRRAGP